MKQYKIFISTSSFGKLNQEPLKLLEKNNIQYIINPYGRTLKKEECLELYQDIDGLIAGTEILDEEVLTNAKKLKVISRVGVGMDNVDIDSAKKHDIKVFNTPDGPTRPVAEMTLGLMLDLLREISFQDIDMKNGTWNKRTGNLLYGKTLGILGLGRIGKMVVELTKPFGLKYLCWDKSIDTEFINKHSIEQKSLDELLKNSDIVTMHLPYDSSMKYLINENELNIMKTSAILINIARGGLVNEDALYNALKNKKIAAAAVDVFEQEPYDGKLKTLDNIILTPHVGSAAEEARINMEIQSVENMLKGFN